MKGFLTGACAATVLFALTSFAYWSGKTESAVSPALVAKPTGPVVLRDLPLNRSFQANVPYSNNDVFAQMSLQCPPTAGVAITQIVGSANIGGGGIYRVEIRINGTTVARRGPPQTTSGAAVPAAVEFTFDPPIIAPPNAAIMLVIEDPWYYPTIGSLTIGGWTLGLGDV